MQNNHSPQPPRLEVITGCMFSGKTEELIRRLERVRIAHGKVLLFKATIDDRYSKDSVVTHYGREVQAIRIEPGKESLKTLEQAAGKQALKEASVIAFDEGNFFSKKIIRLCQALVRRGKRVIVAGLDLTFALKPFGPMPELMAYADQVDKLFAVCVKCGGVATKTQRFVDGKPAPANDAMIKVGGEESYKALCSHCHELR